jgi:choline dehydrogenase-like flavoprotein
MFIDAREVPGNTEIEADLCIVGGGAAGISLAKEFIGLPIRVCLVESGGLTFDAATQELYRGDNVGLDYYPLDVCRLRYFGGSTNAWGGWCRPLDPIDFEQRPWVRDSGWPFGHEELEPYYARAHALCQIENPEYDPAQCLRQLKVRDARVLPMGADRIETTMYSFSPPTRFGRVYESEIRRADNITCLLYANVTSIDTDETASVATRVNIACLDGKHLAVSARCFVLAAGGVENARLLLLSNRVMAAGLGNAHQIVGRYFMEHTHTERRLITVNPSAALGFYGMDFVHRRISARLSLTPALQRRENLLQYSANIRPVYNGESSTGWKAFKHLIEAFHPKWQVDPIFRIPPYETKRFRIRDAAMMAAHPFSVGAATIGNVFRINRLISHFMLESKSEQAPNPLSAIRLSTARDRLGLNRVELDWRMLALDRQTVCRAEDIIDEELRRLGIGQLEDRPAEHVESWPATLCGGWHQIGTTRMHEDPRRGVVDENCLVHGMSNLFIAGSSVFPTSGTTTPTLTIVALTLRLSDHLKAATFARLARQQFTETPMTPARAGRVAHDRKVASSS